ncbi:uncharacterized protein BJ171DRAFT_598350 [Polychytrium aggregatum]|uniref:uncharacterized protein n=1 Tax=Polychytrium aggregatum TaxID=110093 RepID=UPI0022FDF09B|nr:uncharacterized protein BJ171DRAFT_598350 [Polychytrium aggregatum]KAI9205698.1 hypothetical protein BJ171DRAFT_598350 [Polychytrium aggregatum]
MEEDGVYHLIEHGIYPTSADFSKTLRSHELLQFRQKYLHPHSEQFDVVFEKGLDVSYRPSLKFQPKEPEVLACIRLPGQRYKGRCGRQAAAAKIASVLKRHMIRKIHLDVIRHIRAAELFMFYWRRKKKRLILDSIGQQRISNYHQECLQLADNLRAQWASDYESNNRSYRSKFDFVAPFQRMQCGRLLDLVDPRISVIYVSPVLDETQMKEIEDVLAGHCLDYADLQAQGRLHIIVPENARFFTPNSSLTAMLLMSPLAVQKIRDLTQDQKAYIVPGVMGTADIELSAILKVPLLASTLAMELFTSKTKQRMMLRGAPVNLAPAIVAPNSLKELCYDISTTTQVLEGLSSHVVVSAPNIYRSWSHYFTAFMKSGGIVEATPPLGQGVDGKNMRYPIVHVMICPSGQVQVLGNQDQITVGVYKNWGALIPQQTCFMADLEDAAVSLGRYCFEKGLFGYFSFKFAAWDNPSVGRRLNLRYISRVPFVDMTQVKVDSKTDDIREDTPDLEERAILVTNSVAHPEMRFMDDPSINTICLDSGLSFDRKATLTVESIRGVLTLDADDMPSNHFNRLEEMVEQVMDLPDSRMFHLEEFQHTDDASSKDSEIPSECLERLPFKITNNTPKYLRQAIPAPPQCDPVTAQLVNEHVPSTLLPRMYATYGHEEEKIESMFPEWYRAENRVKRGLSTEEYLRLMELELNKKEEEARLVLQRELEKLKLAEDEAKSSLVFGGGAPPGVSDFMRARKLHRKPNPLNAKDTKRLKESLLLGGELTEEDLADLEDEIGDVINTLQVGWATFTRAVGKAEPSASASAEGQQPPGSSTPSSTSDQDLSRVADQVNAVEQEPGSEQITINDQQIQQIQDSLLRRRARRKAILRNMAIPVGQGPRGFFIAQVVAELYTEIAQ